MKELDSSVLKISCLLLLASLLFACAGAASDVSPKPEQPLPSQEELRDTEKETVQEQETPPTQERTSEEESYEMDQEEYENTMTDLRDLVEQLNDIISAQDYDRWLDYLTDTYIEYYSRQEVLQEYSEAPLLRKYNIKLRSLKDYFEYVVVASRRDVRVDDINAIDENTVKVYMVIDDKPIVVYTLEKVEGSWKITK